MLQLVALVGAFAALLVVDPVADRIRSKVLVAPSGPNRIAFNTRALIGNELFEDTVQAPIAEELVFRAPALLMAWQYGLVKGLLAGLALNAAFAWMHTTDERHRRVADWRARVTATFLLGAPCLIVGLAGTLFASIALHSFWNLCLNYQTLTGRPTVIRFFHNGTVYRIKVLGWRLIPILSK